MADHAAAMSAVGKTAALSLHRSLSLSPPPHPLSLSPSPFLSLLITQVTLIEQLWSNHTRDGAKVASGHAHTDSVACSPDNIGR